MSITQDLIENALTYKAYSELIEDLLEQNKTTGPIQSEAYIGYTQMAFKRMSKWDKIGKLNFELVEKLKDISKSMTWLVITEAWCGDAGQILPFMNKMAQENPLINLKLIFRDEHPEIMDRFLTNGARSIPVVVGLSERLNVLGQWGPRPAPIQMEFLENKISQERTGKEFSEYMHLWYAKDRGISLQNEFLAILDTWNQKLQSLPVQAD